MIEKWVFIECLYRNNWFAPINIAINANISSSITIPFGEELSKLSHSIATRLDMIYFVSQRISLNLSSIEQVLKNINSENISNKYASGTTFRLDDSLKYNTLIDFDSFLFEVNSCCELLAKYVEKIYQISQIKTQINGVLLCRDILVQSEVDMRWFVELDRGRNEFIHETAPYLAIDVTNEDKYDLIIMKDNLKLFNDHSKFITLRQLLQIKEGFYSSLGEIQKHLIEILTTN